MKHGFLNTAKWLSWWLEDKNTDHYRDGYAHSVYLSNEYWAMIMEAYRRGE